MKKFLTAAKATRSGPTQTCAQNPRLLGNAIRSGLTQTYAQNFSTVFLSCNNGLRVRLFMFNLRNKEKELTSILHGTPGTVGHAGGVSLDDVPAGQDRRRQEGNRRRRRRFVVNEDAIHGGFFLYFLSFVVFFFSRSFFIFVSH